MLRNYSRTNFFTPLIDFSRTLWEKPLLLGGLLIASFSGVFTVLTVLVMHYKTLGIDYKVENALSTGKITKFDSIFDFITDPLTISLIVVPIVLFFLWKRFFWAVFFLVASSVGGLILAETLKDVFKRVRPDVSPSDHLYSYPSGHTVISVCIFGALAYICLVSLRGSFWKWLLIGVSFALMIIVPFTRIYYNLHYPTDVIAGYLLGGAYLTLLITIHRVRNQAQTSPK